MQKNITATVNIFLHFRLSEITLQKKRNHSINEEPKKCTFIANFLGQLNWY